MAPLKKQLDTARHALAVLTGHAPSDWTPPDFDLAALPVPASLPVAVPSELAHQRPDILAAEARLHAATADVGVATARLYPNLSLSAQITQGALRPENIFNYPSTAFGLAAEATAPVFDGGRLRAGVKGAEARPASSRWKATTTRPTSSPIRARRRASAASCATSSPWARGRWPC